MDREASAYPDEAPSSDGGGLVVAAIALIFAFSVLHSVARKGWKRGIVEHEGLGFIVNYAVMIAAACAVVGLAILATRWIGNTFLRNVAVAALLFAAYKAVNAYTNRNLK
jgi:hypothetical protein